MADVFDAQKRSIIMRQVKSKKNKSTELRLIEILELFYRSANLGKKVERFLKASEAYSQSTKSDILFYVLYTVAALEIQSSDIDAKRFKGLDPNCFDDAKIGAAAQVVFAEYSALGGSNRVAKGTDLLERIKTKVSEHSNQNSALL